jgi:rod shape-determining protein MreD
VIWRRLIFVLVVLGAQGALGALLPTFLSPPDLFLLTALTLTARLPPLWTAGAGYGVGLLQDVLGAGALGFHAAGLMIGALAANFVRRGLSSESDLNHAIGVLTAVIAKWLVLILLGYWMRLNAIGFETILYRFLPELITTLILGPFFYAFANWAFGQAPSSHDKFL